MEAASGTLMYAVRCAVCAVRRAMCGVRFLVCGVHFFLSVRSFRETRVYTGKPCTMYTYENAGERKTRRTNHHLHIRGVRET